MRVTLFPLVVRSTQFVGRVFCVALVVTAIAVGAGSSARAAGWQPAGQEGGGGINLALAPPELQACFGAENGLSWSVHDVLYKFNPRHPARVQFAVRATVFVSVTTPDNQTVRSGEAPLDDRGTVDLTAAGSVEIVTPVTVQLTAADGTTVDVRFSFHNWIVMRDAGPAIEPLLFAVPQYSDIECY
jgi:hypothetical protein